MCVGGYRFFFLPTWGVLGELWDEDGEREGKGGMRARVYQPIELSIPSKNRPLEITFSDSMNKTIQQKFL